MKKILLILTTVFAATIGLRAQTMKTYTDDLVVSVNEESNEPAPANVDVTFHADGSIDFSLANFQLVSGEDVMPVGNINIQNMPLTEAEGYKTFAYKGNLIISAGTLEGVGEEDWLGPMLGEIPLVLTGEITDEKLHVTIAIDMMATLEQIIHVEFGKSIVTGIQAVNKAQGVKNGAIYDLNGRRVTAKHKGIVIVNGKKVVNK